MDETQAFEGTDHTIVSWSSELDRQSYSAYHHLLTLTFEGLGKDECYPDQAFIV